MYDKQLENGKKEGIRKGGRKRKRRKERREMGKIGKVKGWEVEERREKGKKEEGRGMERECRLKKKGTWPESKQKAWKQATWGWGGGWEDPLECTKDMGSERL